jgi:NAD(P)-dependent dehydrogenase (short-subunit alcohol dehydrogenase family)
VDETDNPCVTTVSCDLASLADIRVTAAEIGRAVDSGEVPPLRGFVGNAGVQTTRPRTTSDGFELTFGVNVLANFLLLRLLTDRLPAPSRLLVVGSDTHFADLRHTYGVVPKFDWPGTEAVARPHENGYSSRDGFRNYARSKLAVIYLVHALARRLPAGVDIYTYNPGAVPGTGLNRDANPAPRRAAGVLGRVLLMTPIAMEVTEAGALLARAAVGPRPGETGAYVDRGKVMRSSPASYDPMREEELWSTASRLCGLDS